MRPGSIPRSISMRRCVPAPIVVSVPKMIAVAVALVVIFIRNRPSDVGLRPFGAAPDFLDVFAYTHSWIVRER